MEMELFLWVISAHICSTLLVWSTTPGLTPILMKKNNWNHWKIFEIIFVYQPSLQHLSKPPSHCCYLWHPLLPSKLENQMNWFNQNFYLTLYIDQSLTKSWLKISWCSIKSKSPPTTKTLDNIFLWRSSVPHISTLLRIAWNRN